jgi:hypothetical protein
MLAMKRGRALALLLLGCGCSTQSQPTVDGGVRHLTLVADREITPAGVQLAVRPDSARLGGATYVGFTNRDTPQRFDLFSLDASLAPGSKRTLAGPGPESDLVVSLAPTDLRIASDGQQTLWCAFETAQIGQTGPGTCRNCLNAAAYRLAGGSLALAASCSEVACINWPCDPSTPGPRPTGTVLPDDPVPLVDGGKLFILMRKQGVPVLPVQVFDSSFTAGAPFELDLRPQLGDSASISVYSVLRVDGQLSLVTAVWSGPPTEAGSTSHLVMVPLSDDLRAASGPALTLSRTADYQAYVSGARYEDGKLYLTHNIHSREMDGPNRGVLKVFDVRRGFALLEDLVINEGTPGNGHFQDDHLTLELVDGKVQVFFPSPDDRLRVKVLAWSTPGG